MTGQPSSSSMAAAQQSPPMHPEAEVRGVVPLEERDPCERV